jgi:bifunctional N-acetylglucosamine-1-phosphate-uridyltransferase/glucosamine-1-phosphate-acetyltransferase GlmU-like protein
MPNILGVLLCGSETTFSSMPLLGKPCAGHVKDAMLAAGADAKAFDAEELSPAAYDIVLFAAEHTPCIGDLSALISLAKTAPAALLSPQGAPLAVALPAAQLSVFSEPITMNLLYAEYGEALQTISAECEEDGIAVTDAESYALAYRCLRGRVVKKHMQAGVIVLEPERTVIEADVEIGAGTVIHPCNTLQGQTKIGAGCTLYPGSRMSDAVIGDDTIVEHSVLLQCSVGSHTTVGPFAYLRPQAAVGDRCRVGDFVEIKNSTIGDGTKISHLTYVGDGDLGRHINLGCGVVFSNYDGKQKHRTVVEDNAFIGCNVNLIPPVRVGRDAYVAAGSTVDRDVPEDALFISRPQGVVKEGWVTRRKEKGKL